jgi:serine/threonine protein phosphatase PrpC/cytoskeletal protein RodZ
LVSKPDDNPRINQHFFFFAEPTIPMDVRISQPLGFSQSGSRPNNEDAFFPEPQQATPQQRWFLVCDGVGGAERGEVASQMAVTQFDAYFRQNPVAVATDTYIQQALTTVQDAFDAYLAANPQAEGMGTTLTLLYIHEAGATVAHLGDSRVYLVRKGEIEWRTDDHSYVNELVKAGVLKPADAQRHPQRNVITRAIQGGEKRAEAAVQIINDLQPGDYFFLCTDGVLERITDELLENTLGSLNTDDEKLRMLWGFCHGQTRDNFTGYLIPIAAVTGDVAAPYRVAKPVYDRSYIDNDNSVTVISAPSRPQPTPAPQPAPVPMPVPEPVMASAPRPASVAAVPEPMPIAKRSSSSKMLIGVALLFGAIALGIGAYVFWQRMQQADRQEGRSTSQQPTVVSGTTQSAKPALSAQQTQVITQGAQKVRPDQASSQTTTTTTAATSIAADREAGVVKAVTSVEAGLAADRPDKAKPDNKPEKAAPEKTTGTALIITATTSPDVFVGKKDGKYGLLKKDKKTWRVEPKYDEVGTFTVGVADVRLNGKKKYLTLDGHQYDEVGNRDNLACDKDRVWVKKGNRYGYLNKNGQVSIDFRYENAGDFTTDCTAEVKQGNRTFLIDKKGNEVKKDKADKAK